MLKINTGKQTFDFDPKSDKLYLGFANLECSKSFYIGNKGIEPEEAVAIAKFLQENQTKIQIRTLDLGCWMYLELTSQTTRLEM